MSRSLRYKEKKYSSPKPNLWKRNTLLVVFSFIGGGVSVLAYYFFGTPSKTGIPVVQGYGFPVRTYLAPQEDKNVQKIYDLDQEEAPIVEKILPYQDLAKSCVEPFVDVKPDETFTNSPCEAKKILQPSSNTNPESKKEQKSLNDLKTPAVKHSTIPNHSVESELTEKHKGEDAEKKISSADIEKKTSKNSSHTLEKSGQIGPVFSDLGRAKEFLVRLKAKAEGYSFSLQSRSVKGKILYRVVTKNSLSSQEIKKLLELAPSF
ncbi:hypothetical protein P618_201048 [Holospora obtusa F1]|uniref:Uncharacterized protein n=1 Tax=Holospora obtusa F1 TaxID=1399147 RepID=W6TSG2_HOLOB|nr:hypothetical protein [Holospora obtusa]ETZ06757.1 hypothetical protein P618_201048 [Holospora obtusa F1]